MTAATPKDLYDMEVVETQTRVEHEKPQQNQDATVAKDGPSNEHGLLEDNQVVNPVSKDAEVKEKVCLLLPKPEDIDVLNKA